MADRRTVESVLEWYENSGKKDCLCSEPDMERVGYAYEMNWQVKTLNGK